MRADQGSPVDGQPAVNVLVNALDPDDGRAVLLLGCLHAVGQRGLGLGDLGTGANDRGSCPGDQFLLLPVASLDDYRVRVVLFAKPPSPGLLGRERL
jgi:hypothetical protein